jgi:hypothetical protein
MNKYELQEFLRAQIKGLDDILRGKPAPSVKWKPKPSKPSKDIAK